jgi:predicted signal transduction protein with EAL and GGDEF domain
MSLVLFDIHRFKSINDSFGHYAGDHVIKHPERNPGSMLRPFRPTMPCGCLLIVVPVLRGDDQVAPAEGAGESCC